ncbi:hypothetical protein DITRI_Ditri12bG0173200 [Diplodiscus trichospermus]
MDVSSSSASTSKPNHNSPNKSESPPLIPFTNNTTSTVPVPIIGATNVNICRVGSLESEGSAPGTSQGSWILKMLRNSRHLIA